MPSLILSTRTWIELVERCSSTWTRIVLEVWIKKRILPYKIILFHEKLWKNSWNFVNIFILFHEKLLKNCEILFTFLFHFMKNSKKVWKNSWFFLYIFILFHEKIEKVWKNSWYFVYIFKLQVPYKNHEILLKFS